MFCGAFPLARLITFTAVFAGRAWMSVHLLRCSIWIPGSIEAFSEAATISESSSARRVMLHSGFPDARLSCERRSCATLCAIPCTCSEEKGHDTSEALRQWCGARDSCGPFLFANASRSGSCAAHDAASLRILARMLLEGALNGRQ